MLDIDAQVESLADADKAKVLRGFFKTGEGQYGQGDEFLGITVPKLRKLCKEHWKDASLDDVSGLVKSAIHEKRLLGLLFLIEMYNQAAKAGDLKVRKRIFDFYLRILRGNCVNNWDLVDVTCRDIVGAHLADKERGLLDELAGSKNLWERRVAIISTYYFIQHNDFGDTLRIAETLLGDEHDLIHKAVGWMLREVGKRNKAVLADFMEQHCTQMPRTMLRYAIEKLFPRERKKYLGGSVPG